MGHTNTGCILNFLKRSLWYLIFGSFNSFGQISQDSTFAVAYQKGCAPFTVNIQKLVDFGADVPRNYIFEANLGTVTSVDTFYTYEQPGSYLIYQIISEGSDREDSLWIEVVAPTIPTFNYYYCDETHLAIEITNQLYDYYRIYTPSDTLYFNPIDDLTATIEVTEDVPIDLIIEGFYENGEPNCGLSPMLSTPPLELTNQVTTDSSFVQYVCENEVSLEVFLSADTLTYYRVMYESAPNTYTEIYEGRLLSDRIFFSPLSYDPNQTQLCYRIDAISLCNSDDVIIGDTVCLDINSDLTAFTYSYATYDTQDHIALYFSENENGQYSAIKYVDGVLFDTLFEIKSGQIDSSVYPLRAYTYELIFTPYCEANIQRSSVATIELELTSNYVNAYRPVYSDGTYKLNDSLVVSIINSDEMENNKDEVSFTAMNSFNITHVLGNNQKIWVEGASSTGMVLRSNPVKVTFTPIIYVPDAFSPNNNGLNEVLAIYGLPSDQFVFHIFNLSGEEIFKTTEKNKYWDGRQANGQIINGTYVYKVDYYNTENQFFTQQGSFVLID
ncbi:MAG: gliding motility-associated C-terminal domain-containing protein [Flammeovirgaceae bacterium]|nr:gliding motility-associated C-terminal domain-containing protein [Flammeovirgaceae bacterium]